MNSRLINILISFFDRLINQVYIISFFWKNIYKPMLLLSSLFFTLSLYDNLISQERSKFQCVTSS